MGGDDPVGILTGLTLRQNVEKGKAEISPLSIFFRGWRSVSNYLFQLIFPLRQETARRRGRIFFFAPRRDRRRESGGIVARTGRRARHRPGRRRRPRSAPAGSRSGPASCLAQHRPRIAELGIAELGIAELGIAELGIAGTGDCGPAPPQPVPLHRVEPGCRRAPAWRAPRPRRAGFTRCRATAPGRRARPAARPCRRRFPAGPWRRRSPLHR